MKIRCGIDIVSVDRIMKVFHDSAKLEKIFSGQEIDYIFRHKNKFLIMAGRFAVKEAIFKALSFRKISFEYNQISVITDRGTGPHVKFESSELMEKLKDLDVQISISHEKKYAIGLCTVIINED